MPLQAGNWFKDWHLNLEDARQYLVLSTAAISYSKLMRTLGGYLQKVFEDVTVQRLRPLIISALFK